MPVHPRGVLCRFIKGQSDSWNEHTGRPRPGAFKDKRESNFSAWHVTLLRLCNVQIEELITGTFSRHGRAYLTAQDCLDAAKEAGEKENTQFDVAVEWRPDKVSVELKRWSPAHTQVEHPPEPGLHSVSVEFRQLLATKSREVVSPERYR